MASKNMQSRDSRQVYLTVLNFLKQIYLKGTGRVKPGEWKSFREKLDKSELSPEEAKTVGFWTLENLASHKPSRVQTRTLQEFEERIFPGASHSEYVEAVQFGMVSEIQGENILDEFLEISSQEVPQDRMLKSLSRMWARNIQSFQMVRVS